MKSHRFAIMALLVAHLASWPASAQTPRIARSHIWSTSAAPSLATPRTVTGSISAGPVIARGTPMTRLTSTIGLTRATLATPTARPAPAAVTGDPDDPAYGIYKAAYELILGERWDEARKKFRELAKKYPESEYRDDAEYWIAYSYRETDRSKAMEAYKKFLDDYRGSAYFDDALADIDQLMARSLTVGIPVMPPPVMSVPSDSALAVTVHSLPTPALAPMMKMRHMERLLTRLTPRPGGLWGREDEDLDDETRLRLETLYAVGMSGEDEQTFTTLKAIAVNQREKKVLRVAAIESLSEFRKHEILPVFIEIARNDTSEEMQLFAIDYIGNAARDKGKAFDALMALYKSLPREKVEKRKMVFYSIAEIGNEKAIDFLAGVARSHEEYELRREAIYYLGTIGGDKARAVLLEILKVD